MCTRRKTWHRTGQRSRFLNRNRTECAISLGETLGVILGKELGTALGKSPGNELGS